MTSQHKKQFIQVGRAGGTKQYAHLTQKEYDEYKMYLTLEHTTSQRRITEMIREYLAVCREHYEHIARQFREDMEEGEGEED